MVEQMGMAVTPRPCPSSTLHLPFRILPFALPLPRDVSVPRPCRASSSRGVVAAEVPSADAQA